MNEGRIQIAELGPRLKLIRQEFGITQKELAQHLDMNQAILSKFENGGMVYASVLLDVLCFFRGKVNINYLLQPGDGYNINDERSLYTNAQQRDVIINGKRKLALSRLDDTVDDVRERLVSAVNDIVDFCLSEAPRSDKNETARP